MTAAKVIEIRRDHHATAPGGAAPHDLRDALALGEGVDIDAAEVDDRRLLHGGERLAAEKFGDADRVVERIAVAALGAHPFALRAEDEREIKRDLPDDVK